VSLLFGLASSAPVAFVAYFVACVASPVFSNAENFGCASAGGVALIHRAAVPRDVAARNACRSSSSREQFVCVRDAPRWDERTTNDVIRA